MIKMIATDLDGTMLKNDWSVSGLNVEAVEKAKEQGIRWMTITGRSYRGAVLLMQQYGETLYWHIRRIVVGREDAEDVLQDTCVKVLASLDGFRGDEAQLMPWIYRIATRECLQLLRSRTSIF